MEAEKLEKLMEAEKLKGASKGWGGGRKGGRKAARHSKGWGKLTGTVRAGES